MEITKNKYKEKLANEKTGILYQKQSKEGKITIYTEMLNYKEYQHNHHTSLTKITVELYWENKKRGTK